MTAEDWHQLGITLFAAGNYHTAIAAYLRARQLGKSGAKFSAEFATCLWQAGDRDAAMAEVYRAAENDQNNFDLAVTISRFLGEMGEKESSCRWLTRAMDVGDDDPRNVAQAKFNRALNILASGDWERGWKEYESRRELYPLDFPDPKIPLWDGNLSRLNGKLIWVTSEQGHGDQIQFSRYVPWLRKNGAAIIFDSHAELADFSFAGDVLTRAIGPAGKWKVPELEGRRPDFHISLLSLASRHHTTKTHIPPPPNWYRKVGESYRVKLLPGTEGKKKIGLVWAGAPNHPGDHLRSMPLEHLLPLTGRDDCEFYSFQVGKKIEDLKRLGAQPIIHSIMPITLWSQTAAALLELDALVTVDTACAHLAASMGVKTLMMVSTEPDWRWGMEGEHTPWYASMTIVRQPKRGDWASVVRTVGEKIDELILGERRAANA